ncbi:MAG: TIGR03986 family CRISPR-associated RAMP protein [Lachnospiraceae bacterium]
MSKYTFVNPYNFIPLTNKKKERTERNEALLSGVIQYSVLTRTPLFIPNTSCDKALVLSEEISEEKNKEHKSYEFFAYEDLSCLTESRKKPVCRPVIPGSEIRGMFRSYYEILTESCMSGLDEKTVLSKRTNQNFKPGLIRRNPNGSYDLYKAEDFLWRTKGKNDPTDELYWKGEYYNRECYIQENIPEGSLVYFDRETKRGAKFKPLARRVSMTDNHRELEGYLIKGENGPQVKCKGNPNVGRPPAQKHCCHIFHCLDQEDAFLMDISITPLLTVLNEYKKNKEHLYSEYTERFQDFQRGEGNDFFPVYYDILPGAKSEMMLSPACITREIYGNTLEELAKTFKPCSEQEHLCQACALFGTVRKGMAVSSRLRFSDLECTSQEPTEKLYDPVVTIAPLSTPKLNNMEFYVERPDAKAWFWTYDYYVDCDGNLYPCTPNLAGRKFYWHQMNMKLPENVEKTNQNKTIRPVTSGVVFRGSLYFDRITEKELQQLIWILESGDEVHKELKDKKYGYKLGAAKPLGLGSIACSVDKILLRKIIRVGNDISYQEIPYERKQEYEIFDKEVQENFHKITDFESVSGEHISYPGLQNGQTEEGFLWFVNNHKGYDHCKKKEIGMPNSRYQMAYAQYMKPMTPGLLHTEKIFIKEEQKENAGSSTGFIKDKIYTAIVKGLSKSGKSLNIEVNGVRGSIHYSLAAGKALDSYSRGEQIQVVFHSEKKFPDGNTIQQFSLDERCD